MAAVTCFANTTHAHAHGREKRIFATKSKQKRYEKSIFIALLAVFTAFRLSAQEPTVTTEKHVQKVQTFTSWMELYMSETSPINNPGTVKGVRIEILNATYKPSVRGETTISFERFNDLVSMVMTFRNTWWGKTPSDRVVFRFYDGDNSIRVEYDPNQYGKSAWTFVVVIGVCEFSYPTMSQDELNTLVEALTKANRMLMD